MNSIAILPARSGSKRIKNKNIIDFCGKPIIAYALEAASKSQLFDKIHVSTDSDEIKNIIGSLGYPIEFMRPSELSDDIVGTIEETGTGNVVDYTVDTDTLPGTAFTVNAIINPHNSYPDDGTLPVAATGQKYLILADIGAIGASNVTNAWDNLVANKNDIIQYNGSSWVVFFDSSATEDITYIQNNFTGDQFKWNGTQWMDSYQGKYYPGFWRIVM